MQNKKEKCDRCEKRFNKKALKKKNGKLFCNKCYLKESKSVMPILSENIPKSYLPPKLKERKKKIDTQPKLKERKDTPPKMKGEKIIVVSKQIHLYLTKEEKDILYKKFVANGMFSQDASDRVEYISEKMSELASKIRKEARENKLTEEQMNQKFIEGLSKYSEGEWKY